MAGPSEIPPAPPGHVAAALVDVFFAALPDTALVLHRGTVTECALPDYAGDPRWPQLYHAEVFAATLEWCGARSSQWNAARGGAGNMSWLGAMDLPAVVAQCDARFKAVLEREICFFWVTWEVSPEGASPPQDKGSPRNLRTLALLYALIVAAGAVQLQFGALTYARKLLGHAVAILRRTGLPRECFVSAALPRGVDDWLIMEHWVDVAYALVHLEIGCACVDGLPVSVDLAKEYPDLRMRAPLLRVARLPPPSRRSRDALVPGDLWSVMSGFSVVDAFGWLDPDQEALELDSPLLRHVLRAMLGNPVEVGLFPLNLMSRFLELHWKRLSGDLDAAGLDVVDLALADDHEKLHPDAEPDGDLAIALANPAMADSLRRWRHLRGAVAVVLASLAPALRDANFELWTAEDSRLLFPDDFPPDFALLLLGLVATAKRLGMQLVSPDFAEPKARRNSGSGTFRMAGSGAIPGSSGDLDASPSSRRERRITVWMSTSAFPEACRTALSLAALARIVLRDFRPLLAGNIFNEYFERPASFAAWFSVLVLRRFSAVFASAWEAEWAHAYGLHEALEKDARTCLELLRASDRPETEPVWALLQGLLDGQELRLSRRDAQMIGLAKRAIRTCRHGHGGGPVAGSCWTCAEKRSRRKAGSTEGSAGSGSLIAAVPEDSEEDTDSEGEEGDGSSFLSVTRTASWIAGNASALPGKPGAKKQVRFHPELEIIPTYSADEYPARSARAPDDPELEVAAQDLGVPASFSLAAMLSMRGGEPASDSDSDSDSQGDW